MTSSTGSGSEGGGGTTAEWLQDRALGGAIWAAKRLPFGWRVPLFGRLARYVTGPFTPFRDRMFDNLDHIWPEMPLERRQEIVRAAADNTGRAMIEHFSMRELGDRMADVEPQGAGWPVLQKAQAEGRPCVLITGHFGNYEAAWICMVTHGMRVGGFYRPMANPYINRRYVGAIEALDRGPLFSQGRAGMGKLLRYLKTGGSVLILNDLYVGSGVEMDFLGRPAMTALTTAELALKLKADLIPVYSIRQPDGLRFRIEMEAPIPHTDAKTMTAACNRSLEARISADPGQWFWIHRRWKRKWRGGKGMEPGLHPAELPRQKSR